MTQMNSEASQLTDLQLAILKVLWTRGSASATDITEALREERGLAQQTIATVLSRLERRGIVKHETRQRQYIYMPSVSEPEVRRSMLAELTDRLPDHAVRSHDGALVGSSGRSLAPYGAHCLIRALPATTPPPLEWLVP